MSRLSDLVYNGRPAQYDGLSMKEKFQAISGSTAYPFDEKIGEDIDTDQLISAHSKRKEQRSIVYERMYRKCCHRIRYANDVQYAKECFFSVPEVQLWGGIPRYQRNAVIAYIMIRLRQKGFTVRYQPPHGVWVSWRDLVAGAPIDFRPKEKVIEYELDETTTTVPKQLSYEETPAQRLLHEGCKKDCCKGRPKRKKLSRRQKLEMERRKQQEEIEKVIRSRG